MKNKICTDILQSKKLTDMTREEEILKAARDYVTLSSPSDVVHFEEGAKWADANPNKKSVYTKKELFDMGFGFDLNGNISTPQEIEERTKKYINYRKAKWIEKACEWLIEQKELIGISFQEDFIEKFKQAMEK